MRSSKSRSRSKNNRSRPSGGNVVNRVFDSSGPEGKVRGTPQQIIDKYQTLARDAQLSNDRVAAENFLQHAEHYTRMLGEANREMEERRLQQEREQQARQEREARERESRDARRAQEDEARRAQEEGPRRADPPAEEAQAPEPAAEEQAAGGEPGPIEVPEERKRTRRSRSRRQQPAAETTAETPSESDTPPPPSEAAE